MPNFRRLNGEATTSDDPQREMFYAAHCGYYTDDWSKLKVTGINVRIPCCPKCGCVGFQTTVFSWLSGARKYEQEGYPHYVEFINQAKEKCYGKNFNFEKEYKLWIEVEGKNQI